MPVDVGIDWADDHHDAYVTNDQAEKLAAFRVAHTVDGLATLRQRLRGVSAEPEAMQVAIERPDGLLVASLLDWGYAVYPINPKAVDRYRDRHQTSGAKDDARDAMVLAHILRTDGHCYRQLAREGEVVTELRLTIRSYRDLVTESTRLTNQLRTCLGDYYPAALTVFDDLDQPITLAFLRQYPTPALARSAAVQGYSHPERIDALVAQVRAPALGATDAVARARSRQVLGLVPALQAVVTAKKTHERALKELLGRHPDGGLFLALPGAGVVTAAALLGELSEDRTTLPSAADLRAVGGTAPVTIQSGKSRRVVRRRACNAHLHEALIQFARCSLMRAGHGDERVAWVKEAYVARRQAGDTAQQAYRVLANRWAAILWAMWTRREAYDHARYAKARAARSLPKAS
jgi:hypothetical protein